MQPNIVLMSITRKPPKPYKAVKSEFIKEKIRETDFNDEEGRKYIHALIWLEKMVLPGRAAGWPTGMALNGIKDEYRKEYNIIKRELKPEKFKRQRIKKIVEAIEENLEPEEYKLDEIKERLENKQGWKKIQNSQI